jgi:hypothetical protein
MEMFIQSKDERKKRQPEIWETTEKEEMRWTISSVVVG